MIQVTLHGDARQVNRDPADFIREFRSTIYDRLPSPLIFILTSVKKNTIASIGSAKDLHFILHVFH